MTFRIQKTIISKYLDLIDKSSVTEQDLVEFIEPVINLYKSKVLTENDIFRQKIEFIFSKVSADLEVVRRKRTTREVKLELSPDVYNILKSDLEDIDFSKTTLSELVNYDKEESVDLNKESVIKVLENLIVPKRRLNAEIDLERFVCEQFAYVYGKEKVARQYSVGGFLALKTDVDIGNGQVGIEIKLADSLSATDMQRLIGQAIYYKKRFYNNNLIVFLASRSSISSHIKELKDFIEELGVTVVFCQAVN